MMCFLPAAGSFLTRIFISLMKWAWVACFLREPTRMRSLSTSQTMLKNTGISNRTVMAFENILTTNEKNVLTITINRPEKLNALNKKTVEEIGNAIGNGEKNEDVRAIIITGAGPKSFVAGADIAEFVGLSVEQGDRKSIR